MRNLGKIHFLAGLSLVDLVFVLNQLSLNGLRTPPPQSLVNSHLSSSASFLKLLLGLVGFFETQNYGLTKTQFITLV